VDARHGWTRPIAARRGDRDADPDMVYPVPASPDVNTYRDREVIALVGLAHGTSHFFHLMLPTLFPWLMRDFSLSFTDVGLLTTTFFVISGIGQALAGFVVDRVGGWRVLCFGVGMLALSGVVLGLAPGYRWLMLSATLAGLGNSIFHPADFTLLNHRVTPPRLGHAFSIHGVSGNVGWAVAPLFMAGITSAFGWHIAGFGAAAIGAAVFTTLCLRRHALTDVAGVIAVRSATDGAQHEPGYFAFLASGAVWLSFAFFLLTTMAFGILQNFAPAILSHVYGVSLMVASSGLTAYLVGSGTGMLAAGFLKDGADRMVAPALGFAAVMAVVLALGTMPAAALWPLMASIGFGVGFAGPGRDLLVRRAATSRFGRSSFGRVYGFVYSGLDTGQALSPLVFGPILDAGRFRQPLIAIALLQAAALFTALRVSSGVRSAQPRRAGAAHSSPEPGRAEAP
jgi:FSR family fosmidomycin resistance protein-like MFS transporter